MEAVPVPNAGAASRSTLSASHNLNGQKLGRKGRDTRDRILAAAAEIIDEGSEALSLSAVARRASLGMTSLYNYFTDLTELVLALLEPVMASTEEAFVHMLRERWPDEDLTDRCECFIRAYNAFWVRHAPLLHLRNTLADAHDRRMMLSRVASTQPLIKLLVAQMDGEPGAVLCPATAMATVLMIGIERSMTVSTDPYLTGLHGKAAQRPPEYYLQPAARIMEMSIRDTRRSAQAVTA